MTQIFVVAGNKHSKGIGHSPPNEHLPAEAFRDHYVVGL